MFLGDNYKYDSDLEELYGFGLTLEELIGLSFLRHIHHEIHVLGKTNISSFSGTHRSGKSLACATLGYIIDPTFYKNFEQRVLSEPSQFMDCLEKIQKQKIDGPVIQVEEAGMKFGSADWYEKWLKAIQKAIQVFGWLHPVILFNAPVKDFVDSRIRKMFRYYFSVARTSNDYSKISIYEAKYSDTRSRYYYPHPKMDICGRRVTLYGINLQKPPNEIIERYIALETERKPEMLRALQSQILESEISTVKKDTDLNKIIETILKNWELYAGPRDKPGNPILTKAVVRHVFELKNETADYVIRMACRKKLQKQQEIEALAGGGIDKA